MTREIWIGGFDHVNDTFSLLLEKQIKKFLKDLNGLVIYMKLHKTPQHPLSLNHLVFISTS